MPRGAHARPQNDAIGSSRPRPSESNWSSKNLVTGLYDTPDAAGKAYQDLTRARSLAAAPAARPERS